MQGLSETKNLLKHLSRGLPMLRPGRALAVLASRRAPWWWPHRAPWLRSRCAAQRPAPASVPRPQPRLPPVRRTASRCSPHRTSVQPLHAPLLESRRCTPRTAPCAPPLLKSRSYMPRIACALCPTCASWPLAPRRNRCSLGLGCRASRSFFHRGS